MTNLYDFGWRSCFIKNNEEKNIMERRDFLKLSLGAGVLAVVQFSGFGCTKKESAGPTLILPDLPFSEDALEPHLSAKTIKFHYRKHHQGYVNKVNALVKNTPYQDKGLTAIIFGTFNDPNQKTLFNQAAQVFNHTFFWSSMKPLGGGRPLGIMGNLIDGSFGSYENFCDQFVSAATAFFGSGWIWLVRNDKGLEIITTSNADTPIAHGRVPLITLDVWEHAYYLDYQNRRKEYATTYLNHLVNWEFAEKNLG
jgi:Fe-Mn family superoxide dismutase